MRKQACVFNHTSQAMTLKSNKMQPNERIGPLSLKYIDATYLDIVNLLASSDFYQLTQSVLKIGSVLAERVGQGEVGWYTALADSAWWRLQLPVEKPWSMTGGPFVCFLAQMGVENAPFTL